MSTHNTHYATNVGTLTNNDIGRHFLMIDGSEFVLLGFVLMRPRILRSGTTVLKFFSRCSGWSLKASNAEVSTDPSFWYSLVDKSNSEFVSALYKKVS